MEENSKEFLGKKRIIESPIDPNDKTNNNLINNNDGKNKNKEINYPLYKPILKMVFSGVLGKEILILVVN